MYYMEVKQRYKADTKESTTTKLQEYRKDKNKDRFQNFELFTNSEHST